MECSYLLFQCSFAFADDWCQKQLVHTYEKGVSSDLSMHLFALFMHYDTFYISSLLETDLHMFFYVLSPQDACLPLPQFQFGLGFIEPFQMWQMRYHAILCWFATFNLPLPCYLSCLIVCCIFCEGTPVGRVLLDTFSGWSNYNCCSTERQWYLLAFSVCCKCLIL